MLKKYLYYSNFIAALLAALAIIFLFLPAINDNATTYSGFVITFGNENIKLAPLLMVAAIATAVAMIVLAFTKESKLCIYGSGVLLLFAGIVFCFAKRAFLGANAGFTAESCTLGVGPILIAILCFLGAALTLTNGTIRFIFREQLSKPLDNNGKK